MMDFKAKMHQIRFRLGLYPRTRWGSLQRSPRPPSWIWGLLCGRGAELGWGTGVKGEGGEVEGREREGPQVYVEPRPLRALLRHCIQLVTSNCLVQMNLQRKAAQIGYTFTFVASKLFVLACFLFTRRRLFHAEQFL